ncbi:MAG TPA: hypothetical protein VMT52_03395 [Planctomycetota bacterium]|nr:hypothetical protein [Planctomycetota bacterium]
MARLNLPDVVEPAPATLLSLDRGRGLRGSLEVSHLGLLLRHQVLVLARSEDGGAREEPPGLPYLAQVPEDAGDGREGRRLFVLGVKALSIGEPLCQSQGKIRRCPRLILAAGFRERYRRSCGPQGVRWLAGF